MVVNMDRLESRIILWFLPGLEIMERQTDEFSSVAVDDEHYLFLRQLWNFHPSSLPVSITYENLFTMVPVMQDLYSTYTRRIGKHHPVTTETKKRYDALKHKLASYIKLLLEPLELLENRDPRLLMNEEELLNAVVADYSNAAELQEELKNKDQYTCLAVKEVNFHDLMEETLEYRENLATERNMLYLDDN